MLLTACLLLVLSAADEAVEEGIDVDIIAADAVCCNCSLVNSIRGNKGFNMICCALD